VILETEDRKTKDPAKSFSKDIATDFCFKTFHYF
jgi:hypothetical protein